jgi:hypothetical protein
MAGNSNILFLKAYYFAGVNVSLTEEHHTLTKNFNHRIKKVLLVVGGTR